MTNITITTNNVPRRTLSWGELTPKEQKEFDYINPEVGGTFFRYKGQVYDLGEFMRPGSPELKGWDGYMSDSYFSGIVVKLVHYYDDDRGVIVGWYCT